MDHKLITFESLNLSDSLKIMTHAEAELVNDFKNTNLGGIEIDTPEKFRLVWLLQLYLYYPIKFVVPGNHDLDYEDTLREGVIPSYPYGTPVRSSTEKWVFTFTGWDKTIVPVSGPETYTAQFDNTPQQYTVRFLYPENDGTYTELCSLKWNYGDTPTYCYDEDPVKEATDSVTYRFAGWSPIITTVTQDVDYIAQFIESAQTYTVHWRNEGSEVDLETDTNVLYGEFPSYDGPTPTKSSTDQYNFEFVGWSPEVVNVTNDVYYYAQYENILRKYTVYWVNEDNTVLYEKDENVDYGSIPEYNGDTPTKKLTAQYVYTFDKWTPTISEVTGDITYYASFTSEIRKYSVKFYIDGEQYGDTQLIEFGADAVDPGHPDKPGYDFSDWDKSFICVTLDLIVSRTSSIKTFDVYWMDEDNMTILKHEVVQYGQYPNPPEDPTKESTNEYDYEFSGWTPEIGLIYEDSVFIAEYASIPNRTVQATFLNYDNTELFTEQLVPGDTPVYNSDIPVRTSKIYSYTFSGWDKEIEPIEIDTEYVAQYESEPSFYTIKFVNDDGTELQSAEYAYLDQVEYLNDTPESTINDGYVYQFTGWDKEITPAIESITYTAQYIPNGIRMYTVTFKNGDEILQTKQCRLNEIPTFDADYPEDIIDSTNKTRTFFTSWDKPIAPVTEDCIYNAQFDTKSTNQSYVQYQVKFLNYNGQQIRSYRCNAGTMAYWNESWNLPTRYGDSFTTYTFKCWDYPFHLVYSDLVYTAVFAETSTMYTVQFTNADGDVIQEKQYVRGSTPEFYGKTPTKDAPDENHKYIFNYWKEQNSSSNGYKIVYSNQVYVPYFKLVECKYVVKFIIQHDNKLIHTVNTPEYSEIIQEKNYAYGETPTYDSESGVPKAVNHDILSNWYWIGWEPQITQVTKNQDYVAKWEYNPSMWYPITFVDYDGSIIDQYDVAPGYLPNGIGWLDRYRRVINKCVREPDEYYIYTFTGWDKKIEHVTGPETYIAQYDLTEILYSIVFENPDGTQLQSELLSYGTQIIYKGDSLPEQASNGNVNYLFKGWDIDLDGLTVTKNLVIHAVYETYTGSKPTYRATFYNSDEKWITSQIVPMGDVPEDPAETNVPVDPDIDKRSNELYYTYNYVFDGWEPKLDRIFLNTDYIAQYTPIYKEYSISIEYPIVTVISTEGFGTYQTTWVQEVLPIKYRYGETPIITKIPNVPNSNQFTYEFVNWIGTLTGHSYTSAQQDGIQLVNLGNGELGIIPIRCDNYENYNPYENMIISTHYTAIYTSTRIKHTIYYYNYKNELIGLTTYNAGYIKASGNHSSDLSGDNAGFRIPDAFYVKPDDNYEYTCKCSGYWDMDEEKELSSLKSNDFTIFRDYHIKGIFDEELNEKIYKITYVFPDRTESEYLTVTMLPYRDLPESRETEEYTIVYTWDKTFVKPTEDTTYTVLSEIQYFNSNEVKFYINQYSGDYYNPTITHILLSTSIIPLNTIPEFPEIPEEYQNTIVNVSECSNVKYTYYWEEVTEPIHQNTTYYTKVSEETVPNTHKAIFKNWDGTILEQKDFDCYENVIYTGSTPTREPDEQYQYTFKSWEGYTPNMHITSDTIFVATYTSELIEYRVQGSWPDQSSLQHFGWRTYGETIQLTPKMTSDAHGNTTKETYYHDCYYYNQIGWNDGESDYLFNENNTIEYTVYKNVVLTPVFEVSSAKSQYYYIFACAEPVTTVVGGYERSAETGTVITLSPEDFITSLLNNTSDEKIIGYNVTSIKVKYDYSLSDPINNTNFDLSIPLSDLTYTIPCNKSSMIYICYEPVIQDIPEYTAVDLGLSVKWSNKNTNAEYEEDSGLICAWGETESKDQYLWTNYKWGSPEDNKVTKYCNNAKYGYNGFVDNITTLELEDDAANVHMGGSWRIPTRTEWLELINNTTQEVITSNDVRMVKFTSTKEGYLDKYILIPEGNYQSSSLSTPFCHQNFVTSMYNGTIKNSSTYRSQGYGVRAVCN